MNAPTASSSSKQLADQLENAVGDCIAPVTVLRRTIPAIDHNNLIEGSNFF